MALKIVLENRRPLKRFRRSKRFRTSDLQNTCTILINVTVSEC